MGESEEPRTYLVTTDVALLAVDGGRREVLLVRRANEPFRGRWALPGGFLEPDEDLERSARRELEEETGVRDAPLEQLGAFGDPGRDPRGRVVTVVYCALVSRDAVRARAADDAAEAGWFDLDAPPPLAFDHAEILAAARAWLDRRPPA